MTQVPTTDVLLERFLACLPELNGDLSWDDKDLVLRNGINAARTALSCFVTVYRESCGVDMTKEVIREFIREVELHPMDEQEGY